MHDISLMEFFQCGNQQSFYHERWSYSAMFVLCRYIISFSKTTVFIPVIQLIWLVSKCPYTIRQHRFMAAVLRVAIFSWIKNAWTLLIIYKLEVKTNYLIAVLNSSNICQWNGLCVITNYNKRLIFYVFLWFWNVHGLYAHKYAFMN